jgi:hypothetical protein
MPGAAPTATSKALHETLLHGDPIFSERRPQRRWAYPLAGVLLVSVFVLYHAAVLLIWNLPHKGLMKEFHTSFLAVTKGSTYFAGTRNNQSWAMFAPNPNRANVFVHVYVTLEDGDRYDFGQDIWEQHRYPYLWYDRRGKVNRRIAGKQGLQRMYGAWVCREWERTHAGETPKSVAFVKRWTIVPPADEVLAKRGWDPWKAPNKQVDQEVIVCKKTPHGTLPNELRERYGLPLIDEELEHSTRVKLQTWWDRQERERVQAERAAQREAARERRRKQSQLGPQPLELEPSPAAPRGLGRMFSSPSDESEEDSPDQ